MPRLVNKVPRYSRHKNGQARVRYGGKTTYLGAYGTPESREAYERFIATLPKPEIEGPPPEIVTGSIPLIGELILHYLAHAKAYYVRADGTPTGEHETIRAVLRPLRKTFGELRADQFGPKRLKELQQVMVGLNWSRQYVNKATGIIKRCFKWCASEELIPAAVSVALTTVSGLNKGRTKARERAKIGPVADEMVEATLPYMSDLAVDVVRFMRRTGARPGEVVRMLASELDRSDPACWVYSPGQHKTEHHGKGRSIFIGPEAQQIVLPRLMKAGEDGQVFPLKRASLCAEVYRACRRKYPHSKLSKVRRKNLTKAQRAELLAWERAHRWHPNMLRHAFATEVRREHGLEAAQVLLGHSRADVTQVYAERDVERARAVARRIG
jgi:integrase